MRIEMRYQLSANVGFITNSSSMVYCFPREVLDYPEVKALIQAFEIEDGFVGSDLWHRGACGTVAFTQAQKEEINRQMASSEYGGAITVDPQSDEVVLIYGDEYESLANTLCALIRSVREKLGHDYFGGGREYN